MSTPTTMNPPTTQNTKISLDTIDFYNKNERIQSPRSKRVLKELGIEEHKLFFISLKEYLSNHPEVKAASLEVQQKRYANYDKRRQERINKLKDKRNELIKAEGKSPSLSSSSSVQLKKSQSCFNMTHSLLQKGLEKLEQMKHHHIYEIKTLIDYELLQSHLRRKSDDRQRQLQAREEQIIKQRRQEQMEMSLRKRIKEKEREERIEKEELLQLRKITKREEEEMEKNEEEAKRKEKLEKESLKRQFEHIKNQEELQKKLDQILAQRHSRHVNKLKESEIKDEIRKRAFEERRLKNTKKSMLHQQKAQEILMRTFIKNGEEETKKRSSFEEKQLKKEEQMNKCAKEVERKSQEQSMRMKIKNQKIVDFSIVNEKNIMKKINVYYSKNELNEKNRREREERSKEEFINQIMRKRMKEKDNMERKTRNDASLVLKHSMQLEKSALAEEKSRMQREQFYRATMNKFIGYASRYEENNEAMEEIDKRIEFKKQLKLESFSNKKKRLDDMIKQKIEITEKTKSCEKEINKRKEEIIGNVNKLLKTGKCFTRDEVYRRVFSLEEYNSLASRTMKLLRSSSCSSNISNEYEANIGNSAEDEKGKTSDDKKGLSIEKYMSITPINESNLKHFQLKENNKRNENQLIKDTKLFRSPNNNDNMFFVTQDKFNSLDAILKKSDANRVDKRDGVKLE